MPRNIHKRRKLKMSYEPYCFQFNPDRDIALIDPDIIATNDPSSIQYKKKSTDILNR